MATRIGRGATAAAEIRACCSSTERTACLSAQALAGAKPGELGPGPPAPLLLLAQAQPRHQPSPQIGAIVVTVQCKVNRSLEVPAGISQVVSGSAMHNHVDRMALGDEQRDRVGELYFAAGAPIDAAQRPE